MKLHLILGILAGIQLAFILVDKVFLKHEPSMFAAVILILTVIEYHAGDNKK